MLPLITVVIANWNGRAHLERCLPSLLAQTYPNVEIIVVDNGSADGSIGWLAEQHLGVRAIANSTNRGFAAANNQGIGRARGAYIATLNNDAWADPEWLARLVAGLEGRPRIGMAASLMVFADHPEIINSTGIGLDRCGISWDRDGGKPVGEACDTPAAVFGPCAGAALYRRELFEDVGLFDEDFFAYLEDVDLAWRARWRGWGTVFVPDALVYHAHSATAQEGSSFKIRLLSRNKILLVAKNYPMPYLLLYLPLIGAYETLSLGYALWRNREFGALRGRLAALRLLPAALQKRRSVQRNAHRPPREVFELLAPAAWPWRVVQRVQHVIWPSDSTAAVGL